jgi:hypothetical protein
VNSISLILIMWFDLLHICLSFENGLKENSSYFYCKSSNFHDQWIKLLLTSSFLCNDCLETMSYLYIYLVSIQSVKTFIFSKKKNPSLLLSLGQVVLARQSPTGLDNARSAQTTFDQAQVQGYSNPRTVASSQSLSFSTVTGASSFQSSSPVTKELKGE